jgi:hypothetical protein
MVVRLPSSGGVTSQSPPLVEEETPFQDTKNSGKKKKYGHEPRRGPKPRTTVLARASINLLDRTTKIVSQYAVQIFLHGSVSTHNVKGKVVPALN